MNDYTPNNGPDYPWVKVEDKLPQELTRVLAVWKSDLGDNIISRSFFDGCWHSYDFELYEELWHVTHWQYLPKLPNENV